QAEDGIRDLIVTGVQTCALPIFMTDSLVFARRARIQPSPYLRLPSPNLPSIAFRSPVSCLATCFSSFDGPFLGFRPNAGPLSRKIGRASCRESVWIVVGGVW